MPNYDYDIGIIGAGAAGLTVASGAAQLGAKTLLVEREKHLGGDCLHFGCVPSKTLIRSSRIWQAVKHSQTYGLPEVPTPPVDFSRIRERIRSVIAAIQQHDSEERFCRLGAKVEFGEASFADEHCIWLNGNTVSAKTWVIATGSSPAVPAVEGLDQTAYITNREIFNLDQLPRSMAILGAGPIAVEMAQAFCRLGTPVCVIQRSDQILSREDKDMADTLMQVLANEGVVFHLGASVTGVKDQGSEKEIRFKDHAGKEISVKAQRLLVAMGRDPNLAGLGLENIGVDFNAKGVWVDDRMRTARKHIFAAGDVTGRFQFTHAAGYEGGIVVTNAIFRLPRKADYRLLPWCTFTDPELAGIGMTEKQAKEAGMSYSVIVESFSDNDRSLAEGQNTGKLKMLLDKNEKPIGVQILGPQAGELLGEWIAVLNGKVGLFTLASAVHPYPTLAEISKRVAATYAHPKIFSDRVRKGLKFVFQLKGRACEPNHP
jgi:pyruvate/2-oxoglutarate dehydrogenase complex dihydrolipoamide dehydrogenase (E3) component